MHKIPLKEGIKPFKQKLRQINPLLLPSIEKEVKKLLGDKIIVPLRYSDWVANLVPVRKKNGEIRLYVDFRNLNRASLKDNYPLPKMDHVLQKVIRSFRMSMLDGFSGYNQVAVDREDQKKTTFKTPWGTFMYARMPFGLMNAGATFQRAMDIDFVGDKFVVIYLDDIIVFSKSNEEHLDHLKSTFEKCRRFALSLNLKKSIFSLEEGELLGHIVSRDGVNIDLERKHDEEREWLVEFFSKILKDVELKYNILEKQVYDLVKALKSFRTYVLQSQIITFVPNAIVKDVLVQGDVEGKRGKWIAKIQEYGLDIKPTKLVKGKGLEKMFTE
eukprot:PITA_21433